MSLVTSNQLSIHNSMTNYWVDLDTILSKIDYSISRKQLAFELSRMASLGLVNICGGLYKIGYSTIDDGISGQLCYTTRRRLHPSMWRLW